MISDVNHRWRTAALREAVVRSHTVRSQIAEFLLHEFLRESHGSLTFMCQCRSGRAGVEVLETYDAGMDVESQRKDHSVVPETAKGPT